MLSARRIGSACPLARTRIAWSRADPPAAMRRAISAAIQSASSDAVANTSSRTGAASGSARSARRRLLDPGPDLEPIRIVEPDQPVRGIEDRRLRAIVPPQDDGPRRPVAIVEREDVVDRRAAERVDRLIVVTHDGHVPVGLREQADELGLGAVGVLELVDEDVPEPPGDLGPGRRRLAHEPQGERDLVAEVDAAVGRHQPLIGGVGARQLVLPPRLLGRRVGRRRHRPPRRAHRPRLRPPRHALPRPRRGRRTPGTSSGRDVLVLAPAEQRGERRQETGRIAQRPVGVEVELEEVLAQEDDDLGAGQHADVGRQPELERVLADQAVAERVERRDGGVRVAVGHELVDPDRHLLGGLVGERQREDLGRPGPPGRDEPGDPTRDDLGLAGAGAGDDQQRAILVGHGP